jgi:hypothetical protein
MTESIKWYSNLIQSEKCEENYLLRYEIPSNESLIICQDSTYHKYTKFNTYFEFYKFVKTKISQEYHCFYEVIFGNLSQKIYFDLDMPTSEICFEEATQSMLYLIECIKNECNLIVDTDIMIFNSHSDSKSSFHIIIDNWIVCDNKTNKMFYQKIIEKYPVKWVKFIDNCMYKNIQQFRIYESHKWKTNRVKVIDINSKWVLTTYDGSDENLINLYTLGSSLVSNITGCKILPFYYENPEKTVYVSEFFDEDNLDEIFQICKKVIQFPYKLVEIKNNLILLERFKPSYCNVCERIHENQNPYLLIYENKDIYFNCRRNDKHFYIGSLESQKNIIELKSTENINSKLIKDIKTLTKEEQKQKNYQKYQGSLINNFKIFLKTSN